MTHSEKSTLTPVYDERYRLRIIIDLTSDEDSAYNFMYIICLMCFLNRARALTLYFPMNSKHINRGTADYPDLEG
jgi:hypothetical protein